MDDEDRDLLKDVSRSGLDPYLETIRVIQQLKWKKVCLFAEQREEPAVGEVDFTACIKHVGDCDWLIFCEAHKTADEVHRNILAAHGTRVQGMKVLVAPPPRKNPIVASLLDPDVLFPSASPDWLPRLLPEWIPSDMAPRPERLWGQHAKIQISNGRRHRFLELLHVGFDCRGSVAALPANPRHPSCKDHRGLSRRLIDRQ